MTAASCKPYGPGTNRRSAEALLRVAVDDAVGFFRSEPSREVALEKATAELLTAGQAAELLLERA